MRGKANIKQSSKVAFTDNVVQL